MAKDKAHENERRNRTPKMSDICNTCNGSGQEARIEHMQIPGAKDAKGMDLFTEKRRMVTCTECNGYGKFDRL